ncbi:hypothetical protein [Aureispira anguillae]|uniref:Uncharacterized protein n=1 Tax=Aureispira anguillae TaxID=2864201 RepID=A0A915YB73_9BACT|nr:hypothetical protein [Aureispira anguillae]BDS09870.1 hypothetical protein AsAng_0005750 [Aureispira anguillae]
MYKSKVVTIFRSFDKAEKAGLRRWVYSPIHNEHPEVTKLVEYLLSRRKITPTAVKRERVFKYLYPDKIYNPNRLNHILSFSVEVMEAYISYLMSKKAQKVDHFAIANYYKSKFLPDLAQKALQRTKQNLDKAPYQNDIFYHTSFLLEQAFFDLKGTELRQQQTNLQAIFTDLTTFTIIATLRNACTAISHRSLYQTEYKIPLLAAILEEAKSERYTNNLVVQSYYHSYMALVDSENEVHFKTLKKLLIYQKVPLPSEELKYVCLLAINYCIKRLNMGTEAYVKEVFDIYCYGLNHNIWMEQGHLSHSTFKNIITAALRLKAYDWTQKFIANYANKLRSSHQKDYTNYAKAKLFFEQGWFTEAQKILVETDLMDLFISLDIKLLLLKIYWKLNEFDLLEAHLDSFSVYLNRKKVLAYHRQIYGNTISITRKMIYTNLEITVEREKLHQLVLQTTPLTDRPWFLKQLSN